jgi:hypothetical protein
MSNVAQQMTSKAGPPEREDSGVDDDSILNMEVETRKMRIATEMNGVAQQRRPAGDDPILNMEVITVSDERCGYESFPSLPLHVPPEPAKQTSTGYRRWKKCKKNHHQVMLSSSVEKTFISQKSTSY